MKIFAFSLLLVFTGFASLAQVTGNSGRYHDMIFDSVVTTTVTYSDAFALQMDIYQPYGDTACARPLLVLAHGGSFISGTRADDIAITTLCTNFAKRGYVTASIDYRLGNTISMATDSSYALNELFEAVGDGKAAIRYFRQNAYASNTYKVDTNYIFCGGNSSGALLYMHATYITNINQCPADLQQIINNNGGLEGNSGNPGYSSSVNACLSLAGGLNEPGFIVPGSKPIAHFQGDQDAVVPYTCGLYEQGTVDVRFCGLGTLNPIYVADNITHVSVVFPGDGHVPWNSDTAKMTKVDTICANFLDTINGGLRPVGCAGNSVALTLGSNQTVCSGTLVTLNPVITGGTSPYTYAWSSSGNSLSCNNCQYPTATITQNSSFTLTVTDASNNTATASLSLVNSSCTNQYCGNSGPSVGTLNPNQATGFENPDSVPCVIRGQAYNNPESFKMYSTINFLGQQTVDSIQFLTIENLPCGLCWATNKASNTFAANELGCINISGFTNDSIGQFQFAMTLKAWINGVSTGQTIPANLVTQMGIRNWIRVRNSTGNCTAVDTASAYTGNSTNCTLANPMNVSLGSDQTVCSGSQITLNPVITGGTSPYSYAWSSSGNSLSCNNCQHPTATITQNSNYTLTVTDANNNTATAFVTYSIGGVGTINITPNGSTTFCAGGSISLSAGGGYTSYYWSNGSTTSAIMATVSGTYNVTVTTNSGCSSTGSITVNAVTAPTPQSIIGNPSITPFQNYTYVVSQVSGITYAWTVQGGAIQSGQGSNSINVTWSSSGPYLITLVQTNTANCSDTSTLLVINSTCSVQVSLNLVSPSPVCTGDTVLIIASVNTNGATYQWVLNGNVINGATSDTLFATTAGNYQSSATANGCTTLSSVNTISFLQSPALPIVTGTANTNGCNAQPDTLTLNNVYPSYSWSNGGFASSIVVTTSGNYVVTVTGNNGCKSVSQPYNLNLSIANPVEICIVSVDTATGKNMIIWNNPSSTTIDSFLVYKESSALNVYDNIGGIASTDFSTFIDNNSNPPQHADRYKLAVLDSCGHLTLQSDPHQTIHLTINHGIGNSWNLIWNPYEGLVFPSYYIYREGSGGVFSQISVLSSANTSYTDVNPPTGTLYYQVGIQNPNGCNPSRSSNYDVSLSNIVSTSQLGIEELNAGGIEMISYNEGGQNMVRASGSFETYGLKLYEITGRLVMDKPNRNQGETILPAYLAKGVYVAEASFNTGAVKKIKVVVR